MSKQEYSIGSGVPPDWAKDKLAPYKKMDGSTGCEFRGRCRMFALSVGDKLILNKGKIHVKQQKEIKYHCGAC